MLSQRRDHLRLGLQGQIVMDELRVIQPIINQGRGVLAASNGCLQWIFEVLGAILVGFNVIERFDSLPESRQTRAHGKERTRHPGTT